MAYAIRLTGVGTDAQELLRIEPHWWRISELSRHVRLKFIESNETGSYTDRDADISVDDARTLHEQFRKALLDEIAYNVECAESSKARTDKYAAQVIQQYADYVNKLRSDLSMLDTAFGSRAGDYSHFHLCVFEWDSGY